MRSERKPAICFDFKMKNRIRIHKVTIHLLGDPEYIQLLVNPLTKIIAIRNGDSSDPISIRLKKNNHDSYEIFSKELMNSIRMVYEDLEYGSSYRIYGEVDGKNNIAYFKINDMTKTKEFQ